MNSSLSSLHPNKIAILTPKSNLLRNELVSMLEKGYQAQLKVISTKKQYHHLSNNENNPFNMAHIRTGQSDDDETSEFGRGMKFSSMPMSIAKTLLTSLRNLRSWRLNFLRKKLNSLATNP